MNLVTIAVKINGPFINEYGKLVYILDEKPWITTQIGELMSLAIILTVSINYLVCDIRRNPYPYVLFYTCIYCLSVITNRLFFE
jgi:hypothetical protein